LHDAEIEMSGGIARHPKRVVYIAFEGFFMKYLSRLILSTTFLAFTALPVLAFTALPVTAAVPVTAPAGDYPDTSLEGVMHLLLSSVKDIKASFADATKFDALANQARMIQDYLTLALHLLPATKTEWKPEEAAANTIKYKRDIASLYLAALDLESAFEAKAPQQVISDILKNIAAIEKDGHTNFKKD
jgi:hypothetical protein